MKRMICQMLSLVLVLLLTACGGSKEDGVYAEDGYGEGRMGDVVHTEFFDYTVNSAYTCDAYSGYTAGEGSQMLVVDVTVKNTSKVSIEMYDTDFQAQWGGSGEDDFRVAITTDPETYEELETLSEAQLPGTYTLAVDEERTGELVFEVPEGESDFSLSYLVRYDDESEGDTYFVFFTAEAK